MKLLCNEFAFDTHIIPGYPNNGEAVIPSKLHEIDRVDPGRAYLVDKRHTNRAEPE
jgi:hypothetical protein